MEAEVQPLDVAQQRRMGGAREVIVYLRGRLTETATAEIEVKRR
jgi:hypothetical protein